jgi:hypothetical protein
MLINPQTFCLIFQHCTTVKPGCLAGYCSAFLKDTVSKGREKTNKNLSGRQRGLGDMPNQAA